MRRKAYVKDFLSFAALVLTVFMMVYLVQQFLPVGG
jgi:hypothetical protein